MTRHCLVFIGTNLCILQPQGPTATIQGISHMPIQSLLAHSTCFGTGNLHIELTCHISRARLEILAVRACSSIGARPADRGWQRRSGISSIFGPPSSPCRATGGLRNGPTDDHRATQHLIIPRRTSLCDSISIISDPRESARPRYFFLAVKLSRVLHTHRHPH